jgi:hypothetical protein
MEQMLRKKFFSPDLHAAIQALAYKWIYAGFLVYLAAWFFLEGSRQKTFFYLLLALPALSLFPHLRHIFRVDHRAMLAFTSFLAYFSVSACWGEGTFRDALKLALLTFCLLLVIEACMRYFTTKFLVDFIIIIGGLSICIHLLAIPSLEGGFSTFTKTRFSLHYSEGWGNDNPIDSAIILGLPVIAAWWSFPGRKRLVQVSLFLLILCASVLILFTKSRGPILALGATLLAMTLTRRNKSDVLLLCSACALSGILFLCVDIEEHIRERIMVSNYRVHIWRQTWEQFLDHFWLGSGFGSRANIPISPEWAVTHAHSFVLEAFRVGGIIGGCLLFLLLWTMMDRRILNSVGFFFLLWLIYGMLCLLTNGRLLLIQPWEIEFFAFWVPLLCLHFLTHVIPDQNKMTSPPPSSGAAAC